MFLSGGGHPSCFPAGSGQSPCKGGTPKAPLAGLWDLRRGEAVTSSPSKQGRGGLRGRVDKRLREGVCPVSSAPSPALGIMDSL